MIVTLIFLDEAGDTGFRFEAGASRFFVVTMVIFDQPVHAEHANAAIAALREELELPSDYEFRFSTSSSNQIKQSFLRALRPLTFRYRALVVDKKRFLERYKNTAPDKLFEYVVIELFQAASEIRDAALYMDRVTGGEFEQRLNVAVRQNLKAKGLPPIRKFKHVDSRRNSLIQIADMTCGSIYRAYARGDPSFQKIIRVKQELLIEK